MSKPDDLQHAQHAAASLTKAEIEADIVEAARDLVALWQSPKIAGLPRAERNGTIEETRNRLIGLVGQLDGHRNSTPTHAGSSPAEPAKPLHTPDPWHVEMGRGTRSINGARIIGANGCQVGGVTVTADKSLFQKQADAALMAAAPEMLSMLRASGVNLITAAWTIDRLGDEKNAAAVRRMAEQILPVISKATRCQ
jgi:hypothetical protein